MKRGKNSMNKSVSRFLDDLDRREEKGLENPTKTLEQPQFDDEEKKMGQVLGSPAQNQLEE